MSQRTKYQRLYEQLFNLIMAGGGFSPQADALRKEMDDMPGDGLESKSYRYSDRTNWDDQKEDWGRSIGGPLYERKLYGKRLS